MGRERRRVSNTINAQNSPKVRNPNSPLLSLDKLNFDFSYVKWLSSINIRDFNNMLRDDSHFSGFIVQIFNEIIPAMQQNWNTIKLNGAAGWQFRHCHTIPREKMELVKRIVLEIHGKDLCDEVDEEDLKYWQLGTTQSLRMIAIYSNSKNTLFPVFLDYHHQIHPNEWHNEEDIDSYEHCPYIAHS